MTSEPQFMISAGSRRPSDIPRWSIAIASSDDTAALACQFALSIPAIDFVDEVAAVARRQLPGRRYQIRSVSAGGFDILAFDAGVANPILYIDINFDEQKDIWEERRLHLDVVLWGPREAVRTIQQTLIGRFGRHKLATVRWWYQTKQDSDYRSITMQPPPPMFPSFYPWLPKAPDQFFADYLASSAAVLFIMGEPGTGKTSLLRHFIFENALTALVTYDQSLLSSDEMFISFIAEDGPAVLLVEDAESLVISRKKENAMMSRFLNVSDGLVHDSGKKMIFTTNADDFRTVDEALIRPGRCFGHLRARALTYAEACVAASDAGLPPPAECERITLGELFNPGQRGPDIREIGYAGGR